MLAAVLLSEQLLVRDRRLLEIVSSLQSTTTTTTAATNWTGHLRHDTQYTTVASAVASNSSSTKSLSSSVLPSLDENSAMDGFRVCRSPKFLVPRISNSTGLLENRTITMNYQCRGDAYDRFAAQMKDYVLQQQGRNQSQVLWGRREFPLPDHANILVLGNSHTRQTMQSLLCQYSRLLTRVQRFDIPDAPIDEFHFTNGASIVFTSNSPLVYSHQWYENIRKYDPLHRPLGHYDAIVLGAFNRYDRNSTTNFHHHMLSLQAQYPDEVQYTSVAPPSLSNVVRLFPKPIVALPMFAKYGMSWENNCHTALSRLPVRRQSTVVVVHSRAHIEALGHECGSDGMTEIGLCWNRDETTPYGRKPSDMHRCTGPQGGHPDLLAWDVVEALHTLLVREASDGGFGDIAI